MAAQKSSRTVTGPLPLILMASSRAQQTPIGSASNTSFPCSRETSQACQAPWGFCHAIPASVHLFSSFEPSDHRVSHGQAL